MSFEVKMPASWTSDEYENLIYAFLDAARLKEDAGLENDAFLLRVLASWFKSCFCSDVKTPLIFEVSDFEWYRSTFCGTLNWLRSHYTALKERGTTLFVPSVNASVQRECALMDEFFCAFMEAHYEYCVAQKAS